MLKKLFTFFLPWPLRRRALNSWFGFEIHPTARIGLSWIFPRKLVMGAGTRIDHFVVAIRLDSIKMDANSSIGRNNWITGFTTGTASAHFKHQPGRKAELNIGESSNITKKHHLDCTNIITIGRFTTVAGYDSQLLTHSINVIENRQDSEPISIGDYCFVGTNVVILGGAVLPSYSVLGAKSLLNKNYTDTWKLYGGVPAKMISDIPHDAKYFNRTDGFVY
jgi:acetyltransferase-like isoleucine patch superfamily enzyme